MRVDPSLISSKNGLGMSGLRCTFARVLGVGSALTYALDRRLTLPASAVSRCPCAAAAAAEAAVSTQRKSVSTQTSHGFKRGESVCMRGRQTARLLQPRAPSHSLTHNNTHASAYRLCYSCPATHVKPSRTRTSRDARRVSSESSPVCERRTLLTYTSTRQERDYRGPSTWCANARTRTFASSAYLASRDVAAERRESPKSFVVLKKPASASTGSAGGKHNTLIRSLPRDLHAQPNSHRRSHLGQAQAGPRTARRSA
jgi:hypothetical protein